MFIVWANTVFNFVVKTLLGSFLKSRVLMWLATKLVDLIAKPVYDWAVRKGYMVVKKKKAEEAQTNLDNAQTVKERDEAINELP